jgi:hypothetical protein
VFEVVTEALKIPEREDLEVFSFRTRPDKAVDVRLDKVCPGALPLGATQVPCILTACTFGNTKYMHWPDQHPGAQLQARCTCNRFVRSIRNPETCACWVQTTHMYGSPGFDEIEKFARDVDARLIGKLGEEEAGKIEISTSSPVCAQR